jgi:hypothetical protein
VLGPYELRREVGDGHGGGVIWVLADHEGSVSFAYDNDGRLTSISRRNQDMDEVASTAYAYDAVAQVTGITHSGLTGEIGASSLCRAHGSSIFVGAPQPAEYHGRFVNETDTEQGILDSLFFTYPG